MSMNKTACFSCQIGELLLQFNEGILTRLGLKPESVLTEHPAKKAGDINKANSPVFAQLKSYFVAAQKFHDIPLQAIGTPFQTKVWSELQKIPLGETRSYGEIAKKLNSSPRAVGNACRKNPILIIIPCHRVVSATGIGGFSGEKDGDKVNIKRWLLSHEGVLL